LKRTAASILPLVIATCLLLCSCFSESEEPKLEIEETTVSDHSVGLNFSMHLREKQLYMIYPSLDALSLNLISTEVLLDPLRPALADTKYLDRISYSPDIGESFGRHLFLADDRFYNVLYVDRESQENSVLKWLSKTGTEETWWIDAFPGLTEPLAAVPEQEGSLQVVVSEGSSLSLYRLQPGGQPLQLASTVLASGPLQPMGRTYVVRQGDAWACSVYDDRSKRLYLIHPGEGSLRIEAVYAAAEVHYSTILDDRLYILLFEPAESAISLLERALIWDREADQRVFAVLPVTLCDGTSSVFLTTYNGQHLFLFNERVIDQRETNSYQLSLLYPESGGGEYEKLALVEGDTNIEGFTALADADTLYVLFLRADRLTLLSVSLQKLAR
jgi:hypothetical protein